MCQISFMHVIFIIPMTVTNFFYHLSTFVDFDELFRLVDVGIATLWRLFIGDVITDLWLDRLWCRIDFRLRWSERKMLPSLVTRIRWLMAPLWPSWWGFGAFATFHHLHWGNPWREISLIASPALTMSIFTMYRWHWCGCWCYGLGRCQVKQPPLEKTINDVLISSCQTFTKLVIPDIQMIICFKWGGKIAYFNVVVV